MGEYNLRIENLMIAKGILWAEMINSNKDHQSKFCGELFNAYNVVNGVIEEFNREEKKR